VDVYKHGAKTVQGYLDMYKDVKYCTPDGGASMVTPYCEDYQNVLFKGKKAFLVNTGGLAGDNNLVLENNGKIFTIELPHELQYLTEGINDPILSTFKFTN
jgi:hypothetical protein